MVSILVVYHSKHGSVRALAKEIANGVNRVEGAEAVLRTVPNVSTNIEASAPEIPEKGDLYATGDDLNQCDGLLLGSPTRFGNMSAALKYFIDQTAPQWMSGALVDKPAAVFTSSSSMHGGQESTLLSMMLPLFHHGAILTGIPYTDSPLNSTEQGGTPYGASHVTGPANTIALTTDEIQCARLLGTRVATIALSLITK